MSSSRSLRVSRRASVDVEGILSYTLERWGADQRDAYAENIGRAFVDLVTFPEMGTARDDLPPGFRALVVEQHIVYYRVTRASVRIARVLHARMNPAGRIRR